MCLKGDGPKTSIVFFGFAQSLQSLRKGFLSEGVPVAIRGITGPGAPHLFEFDRRESLSAWAVKFDTLIRFEFIYISFSSLKVDTVFFVALVDNINLNTVRYNRRR